jgi:hypothetical protein
MPQTELDRRYREALVAAGYKVPDDLTYGESFEGAYRPDLALAATKAVRELMPPERRRPWIFRVLFEIVCGVLWGLQTLWRSRVDVAIVLCVTAWVGYWGTAWILLVLAATRMAP